MPKRKNPDEAAAFGPVEPPKAQPDLDKPETPQEKFAAWSRAHPTGIEKKVWAFLGGEDNQWRFNPQVILGPYTADFLSLQVGVCIECDGPDHDNTQEEDDKRDEYFLEQGFRTLRLTPADFVFHSRQEIYKLVETFAAAKNAITAQKEAK